MGGITQNKPNAPRAPPPGIGYHDVHHGALPLETHGFSDHRGCHGNDPCQESYKNTCLSNELGHHSRGQDSKQLMEHTDAVCSHKLSGAPAHLVDIKTFFLFSGGVAGFGQDRKHHYSGLYKQTRGATLTSSAHIGTWTACVEELSPFGAESRARADCAEPEGKFAVQKGTSLHMGQI